MKEEDDLTTRSFKWLVQRITGNTCEIKKEVKDQPLKIVRKMISLKKMIRGKSEWPLRKRQRQLKIINEIMDEEIKHHRARVMIKNQK